MPFVYKGFPATKIIGIIVEDERLKYGADLFSPEMHCYLQKTMTVDEFKKFMEQQTDFIPVVPIGRYSLIPVKDAPPAMILHIEGTDASMIPNNKGTSTGE